MVTTAEGEDPGLSLADQAEMFAREVIAGHPQGAVRRILMWSGIAAAILVLAVGVGGVVGAVLGVVGMLLVMLMAQTDSLA